MTIEQTDVVDIISHDKDNNELNLIISDHLEWDEENEKLLLLQEKLNSYLAFLESDEVLEHYPNSKYDAYIIKIVSKHTPNKEAEKFLNLAKETIIEAGFNLVWEQLEEANE